MTKEAKILIAIAVAVVVGGVLLAIYFNPQPAEPGQAVDSQSLIRDNSHMTQAASAKVSLVEFGDYQCPGCAAAHPRIKQLLELYKDNKDVNFVFRNFPLLTIHPNAMMAAEAAEAAGRQGKFWEMHDILYQRQADWSALADPTAAFTAYAESLGLNGNEFKQSITQAMFSDIIRADIKDGEAVGVNSTPTFFINGVKFESLSVPTVDELKAKIDEALAK